MTLVRSLDNLGQGLADLETCLLSQTQNLESLEVGQCSSSLPLGALLGPGALLPLGLDASLLPCGLDGTGAGSSWKLGENQWCENEVGKGSSLAGNGGLGVGSWSIDENLKYMLVPYPPYFDIFVIERRTRLWSMISTMVASLPSDGPPWIKTTRPTSTNLHCEALMSASPILKFLCDIVSLGFPAFANSVYRVAGCDRNLREGGCRWDVCRRCR